MASQAPLPVRPHHTATGAFWMSRLSAVALVPLTLWWVIAILAHAGAQYGNYIDWIRQPVTSILFLITLPVLFYHAALGTNEILEDYVHNPWLRLGVLMLVRAVLAVATLAGMFSVLRLAFGS